MGLKLKLLFFPFLRVAIGFTVVYTFLNWLLFIRPQLFDIREELIEIAGPFVLAWIPAVIWILPRIKLLDIKGKNTKTAPFGYLFLAVVIMVIPTSFTQKYIATEAGRLIALNNITEINTHPPAKFYTLKEHYIDKQGRKTKYTSAVTGKYKKHLNLYIHIACPIYDKDNSGFETIAPENYDTASLIASNALVVLNGSVVDHKKLLSIPKDSIRSINKLKDSLAIFIYGEAGSKGVIIVNTEDIEIVGYDSEAVQNNSFANVWFCVKYEEQISNKLSNDQKEIEYHRFYDESLKHFNERNLESFTYLERIGNNNSITGYRNAIGNIKSLTDSTQQIMVEPKFNLFKNRSGDKLIWVLVSFVIGMIFWWFMLLVTKFNKERLENRGIFTPSYSSFYNRTKT